MKKIIKFITNCQGLAAFVAAVLCLWASVFIYRLLDPTAGAFDMGVIQKPLLATVYFYFMNFVVWNCIPLDFPTINKWLDNGGSAQSWESMGDFRRFCFLVGILVVEAIFFLFCMSMVPSVN